jgi:DNA polymerase-3 subunit delta
VAIVKPAGASGFARHLPDATIAVLIYGADTGAVAERSAEIVKAVSGSTDDPFNVAKLDEAVLAQDPGRLADEFNALSLMGGKRSIWITGADKAFLKAVEPLIEVGRVGNVIVAEAGNLAKTSPLRQLFERAERAYALPCYQDSEIDLRNLMRQELKAAAVEIEPDAEQVLLGLLAADRLLSRSELAKLALYGRGGPPLTVNDVLSVCGDVWALSIDELVDGVFEGEIEQTDGALSKAFASGMAASAILTMLQAHVVQLQHLKSENHKGRSIEETLRSARPPIFFRRKDSFARQLRSWDLDRLLQAGSTIGAAVSATRQEPELAEAMTSRCLLALARNARQQRRETI